MIDWLNDNTGAVQAIAVVALVIATAFYAWRTWSISSATEKQAEASVEMAKEMREQRMAEDEPVLILDIVGQELPPYLHWHAEWEVLMNEQTNEVVSPWPLPQCTVRVHNAGRGAAVSVEACYLQSDKYYFHSRRGLLLKGESNNLELSGFPAFYGGRSSWEKVALSQLGAPKPAFVIARYEDVHGRSWVSYLDLEWDPAMVPSIVSLSQGRFPLDSYS